MNHVTQRTILALSDLGTNATRIMPRADDTGFSAYSITKQVSEACKELSSAISQLQIQQFAVYLSHESPKHYTDSYLIDKEYTEQLVMNIHTTTRASRGMLAVLSSDQQNGDSVGHLEQSIRDAEFLAQSLSLGLLMVHYVPVHAMSED